MRHAIGILPRQQLGQFVGGGNRVQLDAALAVAFANVRNVDIQRGFNIGALVLPNGFWNAACQKLENGHAIAHIV